MKKIAKKINLVLNIMSNVHKRSALDEEMCYLSARIIQTDKTSEKRCKYLKYNDILVYAPRLSKLVKPSNTPCM